MSPFLLLALLGLAFFFPLLLHPGDVLYSDHSDLLALHLPVKRFLVHSWHETGELPRWCPYSFAGLPLLHDVQTAAFYPPHFLLLILDEEQIGPALSWLIVAHIILAGWCMWLYARTQGLHSAGALVAAVGYMFAGRWLLHVLAGGHVILMPLAWLPLVLLGLERAVQPQGRGWPIRLAAATGAGVAYALIVLGTHPQLTFYAGLFAGLWTLPVALEQAGYLGADGPRSPRRTAIALGTWLGWGAWAAAVAAALAAVQLLPALEAAPLSSRALGVATWEDILQAGPRVLLFLVGPALTTRPANLQWEDRGGLTLLWLAAAVMAPFLAGPRVRCQAAVAGLMVLFALGGALLLQWLPGFRWFRQPSRVLILLGLPVALLAGWTTQQVFADPGPEVRHRCRAVLVRVVVMVLILAGGFALRQRLQGEPLRWHPYWLSLLVTVPGALFLLTVAPPDRPVRRATWLFLFLLDLTALSWTQVEVRPEAVAGAPTGCVEFLRQADPRGPGRVLDETAGDDNLNSPLGTGAHLALRWRLEPVRGYNSFDLLCYKEYLNRVAGGTEPLVPFVSPLTFPDIGPLPVKNRGLLDLLGVRFLVRPSDPPLEEPGWRKIFEEHSPSAYDFTAGGRRELPAYTIYENLAVLPRAFTVPGTAPSADGELSLDVGATDATHHRPAEIREYQPNRVTVMVADGSPGFLVLTDPWYPGWTATVDGESTPVYRADSFFRAVRLPAGARAVVFRFEPASLRWGRVISGVALVLVIGTGAIVWLANRDRHNVYRG